MRTLVHLILVLIAANILMACNPSKLFLMQGTGIATYNRHTGQFEVLWEYTEKEPMRIHDTIELSLIFMLNFRSSPLKPYPILAEYRTISYLCHDLRIMGNVRTTHERKGGRGAGFAFGGKRKN